MQLTLLEDHKETTPWYRSWIKGFKQGAEAHNVLVLPGIQATAYQRVPAIITRYTQHHMLHYLHTKQAILIEHETYNPHTTYLQGQDTTIYRHPAVKLIAVVAPGMVPWVQKHAPGVPVIAIGFPYPYEPWQGEPSETPRGPLAVFPQGLHEHNAPYFAADLADHLIGHGYQVVFASPTVPGPQYPISAWTDLGIEVRVLNHAAYLDLLTHTRVAISTSISGSFCIALYEAHLRGARVVASRGSHDLPPFTEPYGVAYPLWDLHAAAALVRATHPTTVDRAWFDPAACVGRLLQKLEA